MHQLTIMSRRGDDQKKWHPDNAEEIAAAKLAFDEAIAKRQIPYNMDVEGGERINKFDPNIKEILMVPHLVGG